MLTKPALFRGIFTLSIFSAILVLITAVSYSYSTLTLLVSVAGFIILLLLSGILWFLHRGPDWLKKFVGIDLDEATGVGLAVGVLWFAEISMNNFIAPPLPLRDTLDDIFWFLVALFIFIYAAFKAYRTQSVVYAVKVGAWSGLMSGFVACLTALLVIVFAMPYMMQDPLNITEWAARGASGNGPTMAAYFAYESFAGAFLHLLVLGLGMGGVLGVVGGVLGKGAGWLTRSFKRDNMSQKA
jgi:hypothetical protein